MITYDLSILNQKGTPMFYSDIFANRPNFGVVGRIFISTDTAAIYRDTGSSWVLIADGTGTGTITGSGTAGTLPIWTASSVLGDSLVSQTSGVINAGGQLNITTGQPLTLGLQNLQLPTGVASTISAGLSVRTGVTGESIIQLGNNLNTYYTGNVDASKAGAMIRIDTRGISPIPGASAYSVFQIQTRSAGTADPNYTVPVQIAAAPSGSFCIDGSGYGYFYNRLRVGNSTAAPTNAVSITGNMDVAGYATFTPTQAAANNASSIAAYGQNTLSYAAGFSANNIGALYSSIGGINFQTFAGSATFAQSNLASSVVAVNSIDFSSASSTITMTQSSGIRAMTGNQVQIQYQGTNSGTITHAAVQQNLGFYRPSGASGTLTITNAYSHLINALDDYGAGFTFTNRWGIYQAGSSDTNYFAASTLIGTNVIAGYKLDVNGTARISNILYANSAIELSSGSPVRIGANNRILINAGGNLYLGDIDGGYTNTIIRAQGVDTITLQAGDAIFSKNIGLTINPSAWGSGLTALQGGSSFSVGNSGNGGMNIVSNAYYSTNWTYISNNAASWYQQLSGVHSWYNAPTGTAGNPITFTKAMTIDANGILGLGVQPSAYSGGNVALDIGGDPFSCINANLRMAITTNAYALGGTHYYRATGLSSQQYRLSVGTNNHEWYVAPSGTAGNPITYTQAMTLTASGNLLVGTTTDRLRLTINGIDSATPTLGVASGTMLLCNTAVSSEYGMMFGIASSGTGWIQQQRVDGSATAYPILLQPSGGNLIVGATVDTGNRLRLNGSLRIDGQTSGTSGGFSGLHLIVNCDGTNYKIRLENV